MKRSLPFFVLAAAVCAGCQKPADEPLTQPQPNVSSKSPSASSGSGTGIAPMGSAAATGMTPVTGTDSVEGSGMGGIGQSAKNAARNAAGAAGAPAGMGSTAGGETEGN